MGALGLTWIGIGVAALALITVGAMRMMGPAKAGGSLDPIHQQLQQDLARIELDITNVRREIDGELKSENKKTVQRFVKQKESIKKS